MVQDRPRCPRCGAFSPKGATECPTCHAALDRGPAVTDERPGLLIFETWDRPSVDTVTELLEARGVPCLVRGTAERHEVGLGPQGFWRIYVRASDEARTQEILDEEIGREES
jgi:hypothetical protein